jgi:hypothetical protein
MYTKRGHIYVKWHVYEARAHICKVLCIGNGYGISHCQRQYGNKGRTIFFRDCLRFLRWQQTSCLLHIANCDKFASFANIITVHWEHRIEASDTEHGQLLEAGTSDSAWMSPRMLYTSKKVLEWSAVKTPWLTKMAVAHCCRKNDVIFTGASTPAS